MFLNIKDACKRYKETIKEKISNSELSIQPSLLIIQVGNVEASNKYVKNKIKDCEQVGIKATLKKFENDVSTEVLLSAIDRFQHEYDGIIVQLPLPGYIDVEAITKAIPENKDVDGFKENSMFDPCTPMGIIKYLTKTCNYDLDGKHVVVIGRSNIVGKPLAKMLLNENATVTVCHSHTKNLYEILNTADLVISAVGKADFLDCFNFTAPVVDVGINFKDGKMVGDCYNVAEDHTVTPVPGGVGLLTRVALCANVYKAYTHNFNLVDDSEEIFK